METWTKGFVFWFFYKKILNVKTWILEEGYEGPLNFLKQESFMPINEAH